jgi:small ligand-binding sensory domain FIST
VIAARAQARAFAASSQRKTPADAVLEVGARLRALGFQPRAHTTGGDRVDASALVFASATLAREPDALAAALSDVLGPVPFLGFVGASAFHDVRLRERKAALSVLVLPGVRGVVRTAPLGLRGRLAVTPEDAEQDDDEFDAQLLADGPRGSLRFVSLAVDPADHARLDVMRALDAEDVPLAGSFAVSAPGARPAVLTREGARSSSIGVLDLDGVRAVLGVAQAARAIGPTRTVTAVADNQILELDGRRAFDALVDDLPPSMRKEIHSLGGALCAGVASADGDTTLVKSVLSVDRERGAVSVAARPRVGSEIVFSYRDGRAAREDLDELLRALKESLGRQRPRAFVVFSSAARDEELFGAPCFDAQAILARFGTDIPVVGCASAGELCTYGAGSYVFGTSAVIAALL